MERWRQEAHFPLWQAVSEKFPLGFGDLGSGRTGVRGLSTEKNFRSIYFMKWGWVLMMIF